MRTSNELLTLAPARMNVAEARDRYLAENGFSTRAYTETRSTLRFLGLTFHIPNSEGRRRGLPLHDLHHVALGYGTDEVGECEISAWEFRHGIPGFGLLVRVLVFQAFVLGLLIAPRRTLAAYRAAGPTASLYTKPVPLEVLLQMSVGELRAHLGVGPDGAAIAPARRHDIPARLLGGEARVAPSAR